ncbi:unnamed protein product [Amoebophrya sp. A25]|nr:unnamed protein product [Amoebophrya sp. A25]|eukprot:GSA25T00022432001.1
MDVESIKNGGPAGGGGGGGLTDVAHREADGAHRIREAIARTAVARLSGRLAGYYRSLQDELGPVITEQSYRQAVTMARRVVKLRRGSDRGSDDDVLDAIRDMRGLDEPDTSPQLSLRDLKALLYRDIFSRLQNEQATHGSGLTELVFAANEKIGANIAFLYAPANCIDSRDGAAFNRAEEPPHGSSPLSSPRTTLSYTWVVVDNCFSAGSKDKDGYAAKEDLFGSPTTSRPSRTSSSPSKNGSEGPQQVQVVSTPGAERQVVSTSKEAAAAPYTITALCICYVLHVASLHRLLYHCVLPALELYCPFDLTDIFSGAGLEEAASTGFASVRPQVEAASTGSFASVRPQQVEGRSQQAGAERGAAQTTDRDPPPCSGKNMIPTSHPLAWVLRDVPALRLLCEELIASETVSRILLNGAEQRTALAGEPLWSPTDTHFCLVLQGSVRLFVDDVIPLKTIDTRLLTMGFCKLLRTIFPENKAFTGAMDAASTTGSTEADESEWNPSTNDASLVPAPHPSLSSCEGSGSSSSEYHQLQPKVTTAKGSSRGGLYAAAAEKDIALKAVAAENCLCLFFSRETILLVAALSSSRGSGSPAGPGGGAAANASRASAVRRQTSTKYQIAANHKIAVTPRGRFLDGSLQLHSPSSIMHMQPGRDGEIENHDELHTQQTTKDHDINIFRSRSGYNNQHDNHDFLPSLSNKNNITVKSSSFQSPKKKTPKKYLDARREIMPSLRTPEGLLPRVASDLALWNGEEQLYSPLPRLRETPK